MSLEGLVITLTLLVIVGLWNAAPLLQSRRKGDAASTQQRDRLLAHYERVLTNIRDLDEDEATGKIQSEAYAGEREQLGLRGIQILMALDALGGKTPVQAENEAEVERSVDHQIEAAVAAYRKQMANP